MWKSKLCLRKQIGLLLLGNEECFLLLDEIALQWSSFTAEMKNQPHDNCFACMWAHSSPWALSPACWEHWEALSSLYFLRESKSLQILFHGLELNWFFVFSSISILIEGQYLLHLESTGYIKIWKGRLSIVTYKPEGTAYATQEDCSCITGVLVLAHG